MRYVQNGYRGLTCFVGLNADRLLSCGAIVTAILLASWIQSI